MSPENQALETATWDVSMVDAEVKLYLLAFIRTGDHEEAQKLSGLDRTSAQSARGWLQDVGVLSRDGNVDAERLQSARNERLSIMAA